MPSEPESGMGMPSESRRAAVRQFKRQLIQDAAKRVFLEHGIDGASMREIAKSAGYSTGVIYTYFATKEELYAEILRDTLEAQYAAVVESTSERTRDRAITAMRCLWRFYQQHPEAFDLGFYLHGGVRPAGLTRELDRELNALLDRVVSHVGECLAADGLAGEQDAHHQAVVHVTSLFGLMLMVRTGRLRSLKEEVDPMLESYLRIMTRKGFK